MQACSVAPRASARGARWLVSLRSFIQATSQARCLGVGGAPLYDATRRSPLCTPNVGRAIYNTSVSQHH